MRQSVTWALIALVIVGFTASDVQAGKEDFDWGGEKQMDAGGKGSLDDGFSGKEGLFDAPPRRERRAPPPKKVRKRPPPKADPAERRAKEAAQRRAKRDAARRQKSHQDGLVWSTFKDEGVSYVKNSLGVIYRMVPDGPKLPFRISKGTIQAQAKRYGWKMVPVQSAAGKRLAERVGDSWEVFKLGQEVYDAYTGEENVKTAQNKIVAATVAAEIGIGVGHAISLVPGAGIGVKLLAGWAGNNVKQAVLEGLEAWDAQIAAAESEKAWKANDLRLARNKVRAIRAALIRNDFKRAVKLTGDLNAFTEKRQFGRSDMGRLNQIAWDLQGKIYKAMKAHKEQQRKDAAARQAEFRRKLKAWDDHWKREARKKEAEEQAFSVRLFPSTTNVKPGERVNVGVLLYRGLPPFALSGTISRKVNGQDTSFTFSAPSEPGVHQIEVKARDAAGRKRSRSIDILVEGEKKKKKAKKKKPKKRGWSKGPVMKSDPEAPGWEKCRPDGELKWMVYPPPHRGSPVSYEVPLGGKDNNYKNGMQTFYSNSGKVTGKHPWVCGKSHGVIRSWTEAGQLTFEAHYREGVQHGKTKRWRDNGVFMGETPYVNGKYHGVSTFYGGDGKLTSESKYERHKKVWWKGYFASGRLKMKITYDKNGNEAKVERFRDR